MSTNTVTRVESIQKHTGIAGQFSMEVKVSYGDEPSSVTFVGSTYGGPIVMVMGSGSVFVSRQVTDRIGGTLTEGWVRRFFGDF